MLRVASTSIAKRAILNSSRGVPSVASTSLVGFHTSSRREEEAKAVEPVKKGGLFGTGINEWFALPVGIAVGVPLIKYEWLVINEETQLMAVFIAFCVTFYTQGGDALHKMIDESSQTILKEHTEAEEKVIDALEQKLEFLKANSNMVQDFEAINKMREAAYANLNAAGKVKPKHDFKVQVERMINMIAQEEQSVADKAKSALMEEATAAVTTQFESSKELKKAALDSAIATIKGGKAGSDPVAATFIKFFQDKAASASKTDDGAESVAQRAALVAKLNSIAKTEKFFFEFDASGTPKMTA